MTPEDIDTGAVIVTSEAVKKKNAEAIAALFSAEAGKFICATAGHNLESILAAYGSGAVHMTYHEGGDFTVMNVDIGPALALGGREARPYNRYERRERYGVQLGIGFQRGQFTISQERPIEFQ